MSRFDREFAEVQHRRGTVMGLTVAESFMLIAFALLMLLSLWRMQADEDQALLNLMSESQRAAIERLVGAGELDAMLALVEAGVDPGRALAAIKADRSGMKLVPEERLAGLETAARLVIEADVRALAELAAKLPPEQRRALSQLVALEDYREVLEKLDRYKQLMEEAAEAQRQIASLEAKLAKEDPDDALRDRIQRRINAFAQEQAALVATLRARLGASVQEIGGRIEANGTIVLPERVVFRPGEAEIQPAMARFLDAFCVPWITTLHQSGRTIDEVRIEGHASPEWGAVGARSAFENNLSLSQRRASAVLLWCLDLLRNPGEEAWAKKRLAAVGYSSSRPVITEGAEDHINSRRVVFSVLAPPVELLDAIEDEVAISEGTNARSSSRRATAVGAFQGP